MKALAHIFPLIPPLPHQPFCSPTWPCLAQCTPLGTVNNNLFNGNHLLLCWPHYTWIIIKLTSKNFPGGSGVKKSACSAEMLETQEIWVRSLGREDPMEEGMATYFSILVRRIPWTEEASRLQSMGLQRVGHDWSDWAHMHILKQILKLTMTKMMGETLWPRKGTVGLQDVTDNSSQ